jgi:hypothetical protein
MMKRNAVIAVVAAIGAVALGMRLLRAEANGLDPRVVIHSVPVYPLAAGGTLHSISLATPPVIDGQLSDWPAAESIELTRYTAYSFVGSVDDTNDLSSLIRSGWDDQHVYFAIQVTDDVVMADSTDVWRDDGVEIGLDGLNDDYPWGWDDHQYTIVVDGRKTDRGAVTSDITAAVYQYAGGYNIEVAIPMSKLLSGSPISGTVMGFTIGLHDDDDGGSWDAYLIWQGTNTSSSPEQFGDLEFSQRTEDRLIALEAKLVQLERKLQELQNILNGFKTVEPPQ